MDIKKVLIANRGEIAVRIIRTLKEMEISSVAVFSEPDRHSLHVRLADEAVPLPGASSRETYLDIDKILSAAEKTKAQAIHPGYGFLAENPEFVASCKDKGLLFIGPDPKAMRLMGHKTTARRLMTQAGVPVIPGTLEPVLSLQEVQRIASDIGYPLLIKAKAGGGGKGMRIVSSSEELPSAFRSASSEALQAFGDGEVYLEKLLSKPRHIEIQIMADADGRTFHLLERECSMQRRHQKVIEESPSVILDERMRQDMGAMAVKAAKAVGYVGAGTIECLVDEHRNFYFLEMNTRLQVEHPVTEMILGLDLVRMQIEIAQGKPLELEQPKIEGRGHAIECRIYAEDPDNNFIPSPGLIRSFRAPGGPFVRLDSGVFEGAKVPIHYDPIIAKLIVWDSTRELAIKRMVRALGELKVRGIRSNVSFLLDVIRSSAFIKGDYDTRFLDHNWPALKEEFPKELPAEEVILATAATVKFRHEQLQKGLQHPPGSAGPPSFWRYSPWKVLN